MLTLGWHWKRESRLSLSGLHLSEHLTLLSQIITTSVNLTSTSHRRKAAEYTDLIRFIMLQLLIEMPQSFGQKRNFLLFFFSALSQAPPPCFTFVMDAFSHCDYAYPAVRMSGYLLYGWLVSFSLDSPRTPHNDCLLSTSHVHWPLTLTVNNKQMDLNKQRWRERCWLKGCTLAADVDSLINSLCKVLGFVRKKPRRTWARGRGGK